MTVQQEVEDVDKKDVDVEDTKLEWEKTNGSRGLMGRK